MAATVFAPRYAQAFASVASSAHLDVPAAQRQMKDFLATLDWSRELREALTNPAIAAEQKLAVLDAVAERQGMIREVRNFLAVMMDHGRLNDLAEIIAEYDRLAERNKGIAEAQVTSARELNEEDRRALEAQVARLAGSHVQIAYSQDASLLGGAVVRIGSTVYDGSVRAQLEQMKHALTSA